MIPSLRIPRTKQKSCQFYEARHKLEAADAQEGPMTTVWIYVDTNKEVGDVDHLKVSLDRVRVLQGYRVGAIQDAPRADPDAQRHNARPARRQDALR
jgi:hypothetical protein